MHIISIIFNISDHTVYHCYHTTTITTHCQCHCQTLRHHRLETRLDITDQSRPIKYHHCQVSYQSYQYHFQQNFSVGHESRKTVFLTVQQNMTNGEIPQLQKIVVILNTCRASSRRHTLCQCTNQCVQERKNVPNPFLCRITLQCKNSVLS